MTDREEAAALFVWEYFGEQLVALKPRQPHHAKRPYRSWAPWFARQFRTDRKDGHDPA